MKKFYNMFKTFACLALCLIILADTTGIGNINGSTLQDSGEIIIHGSDAPILTPDTSLPGFGGYGKSGRS